VTVGCVFCSIVAGEASSYQVAESDRALAFLDINPATEGHTLVIPDVAQVLQKGLRPDGMTLFQANGKFGWQHVFHFHMHVVPRWADDTLHKPWEMKEGDPTQLADVYERLR
jgi:histidine triad (HIT) family protein